MENIQCKANCLSFISHVLTLNSIVNRTTNIHTYQTHPFITEMKKVSLRNFEKKKKKNTKYCESLSTFNLTFWAPMAKHLDITTVKVREDFL